MFSFESKIAIRNAVLDVIVIAFIILFVYAAASKLMDVDKFRVQLGQSPLLTTFAPWVTFAVPALEVAIALALTIRRLRLVALFCAFTLMVVFTAYILAILNFSNYVPCSCGGVLERLSWAEHLLFNILFVALAATGIVLETKARESDLHNPDAADHATLTP